MSLRGGCGGGGDGGVHLSPAYSAGESVFRRTLESRCFSGCNCRYLSQIKIHGMFHVFISERGREEEEKRRGNGGWRG